jgi:hypothetical protein
LERSSAAEVTVSVETPSTSHQPSHLLRFDPAAGLVVSDLDFTVVVVVAGAVCCVALKSSVKK